MQYIIDFFSNNALQIMSMIHILLALSLIGLIFIQQGKGSDIGASFGSGSSNTMFGAQGSFSFLFKLTAGLVFLFFVSNIFLNRWFITHDNKNKRPSAISTNLQQPAPAPSGKQPALPPGGLPGSKV